MEYEPLSKIFYSNPKSYKSTFESRFNNPNTIHFDFCINDNPAFLVLDPSIYSNLADIYRKDKEVLIKTKQLPGKAIGQFAYKCLIDEIILTNNIEGIHSSRKEINSVITDIDNNSSKNKRFNGLVKKYLMLQQDNNPVYKTCEDIRNLYNELVYAEVKEDDPDNLPDGKLFRKDSASVMTAAQKEIHRGVNPEKEIIKSMTKALDMLNNDSTDIIIRISIFHYLFGYIHPFYDGNGRTSRFISSSLLSQVLEPIIGYRISYTIKENLKNYYNSFKVCNDTRNLGDLTPFVIMFTNIINESMTQLIRALDKRIELFNQYCALIVVLKNGDDSKIFDLYFLLIQASLFSENGISIPEILDHFNISRSTLTNRLKKIDTHLLIEKTTGKYKYYSLDLKKLDDIIDKV